MSDVVRNPLAQIDGRSATVADLTPLAFAGFAHFTAMQVRDRKVKGLDLHLNRLRNASIEFFGRALPDEQVRTYIRAAIAEGAESQSLTATVFSKGGEFTISGMNEAPSVLVRTGAHSDGPEGPLRLIAVEHERSFAAIKHVGEAAKTYYLHQAKQRGFDDAAFVDRQGRLSEATIWNLAFWDGETIVWPKSSMLTGTMMGIVQRRAEGLGIPQRHEDITLARLQHLSGAAVMNSWTSGVAVSAIESTVMTESNRLVRLLHEAHAAEPSVEV